MLKGTDATGHTSYSSRCSEGQERHVQFQFGLRKPRLELFGSPLGPISLLFLRAVERTSVATKSRSHPDLTRSLKSLFKVGCRIDIVVDFNVELHLSHLRLMQPEPLTLRLVPHSCEGNGSAGPVQRQRGCAWAWLGAHHPQTAFMLNPDHSVDRC